MVPSKSGGASSVLAELSDQLASAVETAGNSVVAIHARRRIPSSGIVWRDGVIVSASHTVRRDDDISITLPGGETAKGIVAGRDPATDLVALRVKGQTAVARKADGDALRVGALVLAVGRPGRHTTASFGIISAIPEGWRTWQGSRLDRALRLDLAIYDGFSGGPLVDASGAVLGINNSVLARGVAMALPASAVDRVVDELLERGHVRRPFIGIAVQPVALSAAVVRRHQLADVALLVVSVADGSPADAAGVFVGDILVRADGQPLARSNDLLDLLTMVPEDGTINLDFLRGRNIESVQVKTADRAEVRE